MAGKYQAYPEYKDSGTHWIGMIPKQWDVKKAKHLFRLETGGTPSTSDDENFDENGITWVKPDNLNEFIPVTSTQRHVSESGVMGIPIIPKGSILVCGIGTVGKFGIAGADLITNQQINAFIPDSRFIDQKFAKYLIASSGEQLAATANKVVVAISNKTSMQNILLCIPLKSEQQQIANFLDHETAKIDTLIEKQQQLIQLLKEKRQAVISHAVTKGLNPDVPMRDSGVEWLGEVPEHWVIAQLKFNTLEMQTGPFGSQLHAEDYIDGGIPLVNPAHMSNGKIIPDSSVSVDTGTWQRLKRHQLFEGDLIFARRGELGRCAIVTKEQEGWLCGTGSLKAKLNDRVIPEYSYLLISSEGVISELTLESKGSTMDNLNTETLGRIRIPVPPLDEQKQVLAYVAEMASKFSSLIENANAAIDLMQERRTALISAAVTGKIDVRNWVAPAHP